MDVKVQRSRSGGRAALMVSGLELEDTLTAGRGEVVEEDMARVGRRRGKGRWVRGCLGMANREVDIVSLGAWRRHENGRGIVDVMY